MDLKVTTELLYRGTLVFALMDAVYVALLVWRVKEEAFRRLKGALVIAAALVWCGIWSWALGNYWESVYAYVFPVWTRTWIPWMAFVLAGALGFGLWALALRSKWNPVLTFCLLGGALGSLTHVWAVRRGVLMKPPMLQGASPFAAVIFAFFEYIFYWCTILVFAKMIAWIEARLRRHRE
jgi:hypothetical protein